MQPNLNTSHLDRRALLRSLGVAGAGLLLEVIPLGELRAADQSPVLKPGDFLVGRWANDNPPWGYWRHVGIVADATTVIEGGAGYIPIFVASRTITAFWQGYANILAMRLKREAAVKGPMMAAVAKRLLRDREKLTCAALANRCYREVHNTNPGWLIPDHIANSPLLLQAGGK